MTRTAASDRTASALDRLRAAVADLLPLAALDAVEYAAGHALFEARSDQRERVTRWLVRHLAARGAGPSRVLSIGCGDGSVDVRAAASLAAQGCHVDYVGIEPHAPSARACTERLLRVPGVRPVVLGEPFEQTRPDGRFDVVLAVHSLYYVADLAATLRRATGLLAPGGELVVMHAPREPLNTLVRLLAPGPKQAFSDEVAALLRGQGRWPQVVRIDNRLDLGPSGDPDVDRRLLEFTVQTELPASLRPLVRAALAECSLPEPGLVLSHPIDALIVT